MGSQSWTQLSDWERERERESVCVCVCVCCNSWGRRVGHNWVTVCVSQSRTQLSDCVCLCVCVCRQHQVLAAASSMFWLWHVGSSSLIRDQAQASWIGSNGSGGQGPFLPTFRTVREELVLILWTYGKHYLSHLSLRFSFWWGGGSFLITIHPLYLLCPISIFHFFSQFWCLYLSRNLPTSSFIVFPCTFFNFCKVSSNGPGIHLLVNLAKDWSSCWSFLPKKALTVSPIFYSVFHWFLL